MRSATLAALTLGGALAAVPADLVTNLPGFGAPLSTTYSGYLTINSAAGVKHLHYLLYTSQAPATADTPVTLWLNGGPGCSSLEGALQEGGPLWTAPGGTGLALNNYSVNRFAHTLYLEAPAGVGFSWCEQAAGCVHTDDSTAVDNLAAVVAFYAAYPEYATNPFWITGESYAGIYIPTLAHNIWQSNEAGTTNIPLKGILVGNGCLGNGNNVGICGSGIYGDYLTLAQFAGHGFISSKTWAAANEACGNWTAPTSACNRAANAAGDEIGNVFDIYDIYSGVWGVCNYGGLASPKTRATQPRSPRRPIRPGSIASRMGATPNGCTTDLDLKTYLNTPAVQTALHVRSTAWDVCANIDYTSTVADERTTIYPDLITKAKINVYIFNGDADGCVPITDNEWWTASMGYPVKQGWTQWTASDGTPGGYSTDYAPPGGGNFSFISIRAAGHMVHQTQPVYGYDLFYRAIMGLPWSS